MNAVPGKFWFCGLMLAFVSGTAVGGSFLEMPDTTEVPSYEEESLLLDMDVPGVRDRSPDPQAGPRLNVREFRVQGLVEYPELGITREAVMKKVEAIRFDMMAEDEMLESGYTLEELASLSDLIAEIEEETKERHVGPLEVQRVVFHVREQRRERGVTLGMIETVADTITQYYRERGFILAKAYIPKQRVRDGVVNLTVLMGDLGEVRVENNQRYRDRTIERLFDGILDKPVKAGLIEERLFFVNDLPGLRARGFFEPGLQVGDSRMIVNVTDERRLDANLRIDNHGSENSGEYRLYGDVYWHNPTGMGDQLQVGVLNSYDPDNSLYGMVRYRVPAYFPRLKFSMGASNNDFLVGSGSDDINSLTIEGKSTVLDAGFDYHLLRTRLRNRSLHLNWAQIESEITFDGQSSGDDSVVENVTVEYRFERLDEKRRLLHQGGISATASRLVEATQQEAELDQAPELLNLDYTLLAFWRLPFTEINTRVISRTSLQYSGTALSSVNQFSLSGPRKARGYALNAFFADDGVHTGIDWIFPGVGPLKDMVQPMLFADYGYGLAYSVLEDDDESEGEYSDVGLGFRINVGRAIRGSVSVAQPLSARNTALEEGQEIEDDVRVYFDLQYSY
ncbi:ShlB/FhaC/HecB family hemolysin secretion/activation protein [Marinimicrobium agarilyticum]|uniref:ShlB/FhaC/HecB family hemolysin secretion/activation protein n=1 Tax=Marinimicrobium agarilyticum TaxID=306546 RepID=UPI000687CE7D|nr:ShlB/FhaC/HecB family hemolysin secretion/activation protein [Marinimicrobium agarilyticum]